MSDMSRHNLKKNELEDFVLKIAEWIKNNRQLAGSIAGIAGLVILLTIFVAARYHTVRLRADEKLAFAQANFFQGKQQEGAAIFDEIITQYPGTNADYKARLQKAAYLLEMQSYDEAEKVVTPVTEKGKPANIKPMAMSLLGAIRENAGKYNEAAATYSAFLDTYPEHYYTPKIYESLARVYELSGAMDSARSTYEKLSTLYPSTAWSARAQERISALVNAPAGSAKQSQNNQKPLDK